MNSEPEISSTEQFMSDFALQWLRDTKVSVNLFEGAQNTLLKIVDKFNLDVDGVQISPRLILDDYETPVLFERVLKLTVYLKTEIEESTFKNQPGVISYPFTMTSSPASFTGRYKIKFSKKDLNLEAYEDILRITVTYENGKVLVIRIYFNYNEFNQCNGRMIREKIQRLSVVREEDEDDNDKSHDDEELNKMEEKLNTLDSAPNEVFTELDTKDKLKLLEQRRQEDAEAVHALVRDRYKDISWAFYRNSLRRRPGDYISNWQLTCKNFAKWVGEESSDSESECSEDSHKNETEGEEEEDMNNMLQEARSSTPVFNHDCDDLIQTLIDEGQHFVDLSEKEESNQLIEDDSLNPRYQG